MQTHFACVAEGDGWKCGRTPDEAYGFNMDNQLCRKHNGQLDLEAVFTPLKIRRTRTHQPVVDGHIQCSSCGSVKPVSDFGRDKASPTGYVSACRTCRNDRDFKRRYGISTDVRDQLIEFQDGTCAICGADLYALPDKFVHLDHDHVTGEPRGACCQSCNSNLLSGYEALPPHLRDSKLLNTYLSSPPYLRMGGG